ncbi:MAG: Dabb family protein [Bacteroidetes bacterium]|nr:Dabb family protein [Bacteroidota bacterium]
MKSLFILLITIAIVSCNSQPKIENDAPQHSKPDAHKPPKRMLLHEVFLDLNDSISDENRAMVFTELKRLENLPEVYHLHVGKRAETGDERMPLGFDIGLHVVFESEEQLKAYSNNETHLQVRANIKEHLAAKPVVYDFWVGNEE